MAGTNVNTAYINDFELKNTLRQQREAYESFVLSPNYNEEELVRLADNLLKEYPDRIDEANEKLYNRVISHKQKYGRTQAVGSGAVGFDGKSPYCAFSYEKVSTDSLSVINDGNLRGYIKKQVGDKLQPGALNSADAFKDINDGKYYEYSTNFDEIVSNAKDGDLISFRRDAQGWSGHAVRINKDEKNGEVTFTSFNGDHLNISVEKTKRLYGNWAKNGIRLVHVNDYIKDETINYLRQEQEQNPELFAQKYPKKQYLPLRASDLKFVKNEEKNVMKSFDHLIIDAANVQLEDPLNVSEKLKTKEISATEQQQTRYQRMMQLSGRDMAGITKRPVHKTELNMNLINQTRVNA